METKAAQRGGPVGPALPTLPVTFPSCVTFWVSVPVGSRPPVSLLLPTQPGPGRRLGSETVS